jgi:hypothetical protein
MFMIHTPQTVELFGLKSENPDDAPASDGSITFSHESDDVSRCHLIVRVEDRIHTFTFNTRGGLVETAYEDDRTREAAEKARKDALALEAKQRKEEQEAAKKARDNELSTADDTTADDVAWDAPHGDAQSRADAYTPEGRREAALPPYSTQTPQPGSNPFEQPARDPHRTMENQHG